MGKDIFHTSTSNSKFLKKQNKTKKKKNPDQNTSWKGMGSAQGNLESFCVNLSCLGQVLAGVN